MVFSIKIFVFWSLIGCKIAIFGTIFRLRNWFGDSNANCHFTTEICMFVPSNLYMKSKKVSYNCFFLTFSWKRMEKLKNMYFIYKFIIGCPLHSSHPVAGNFSENHNIQRKNVLQYAKKCAKYNTLAFSLQISKIIAKIWRK